MKSNPYIHKDMAVVVMGLGVSGRAAVRYLHELGARVYVSDRRSREQFSSEELELVDRCCSGLEDNGHTLEFITGGELLVVSPGVPKDHTILAQARRQGTRILGELALAAPVLEGKVAAVTGTNGKTTVTTLIGELVKAADIEVEVCGNIGKPLLECLMAARQPEAFVVEVSSFQLENSGMFRPDVAVMLNITPDHLDWHTSFAEYIRAKAKIFANQRATDTAIICNDDTMCMSLADHLENVPPSTFGHSRDCDSYICESEIYLRWQGEIEKYDLAGTAFDNFIGHRNCAAAILAARHMGVDPDTIQAVLEDFEMLPHRMEFVDVIDGVNFYNDSKATNTGAVAGALQQVPGKVVLIAGGREKGEDYSPLAGTIAGKVRALVLIGEAAERMARQFEGVVPILRSEDMWDAVNMAYTASRGGDTVLLSPACASFDMFTSYAHRGEVFRECVARIKRQGMEKAAV